MVVNVSVDQGKGVDEAMMLVKLVVRIGIDQVGNGNIAVMPVVVVGAERERVSMKWLRNSRVEVNIVRSVKMVVAFQVKESH